MKLQPFFITGIPRTRTAWLANFFTTKNSFCWHDAMKGGWRAEHVHDKLMQAKLAGNYYCGDADSGLLLVMERMNEIFPQARWLFVRTTPADAARSYREYFTEGKEYPGVPAGTDLEEMMENIHEKYEAALASVPASRRLEVDKTDLDHPKVMESVWRWLVPGLSWDPLRYELLNELAVNVLARKVKVAALPNQLGAGKPPAPAGWKACPTAEPLSGPI
jgi:hypothetical protein